LELMVQPGDLKILAVSAIGRVLSVQVNTPGDFSTYTLRLVTTSTNLQTPAGFDPQLSEVDFSFKVDCPSDFDCAPEDLCPPEPLSEPEIDYLAKDYASFRRLLLDRLSVLMPDWKERNTADLQVMLVELLSLPKPTWAQPAGVLRSAAMLACWITPCTMAVRRAPGFACGWTMAKAGHILLPFKPGTSS
jgi:hypothetical protein